jgi:hypothetical protein
MAKSYAPTAIIEIEEKKSRKPGPRGLGFLLFFKRMKTLQTTPLIAKTLGLASHGSPSLNYLQ